MLQPELDALVPAPRLIPTRSNSGEGGSRCCVEAKLAELGLTLPEPMQIPAGMSAPLRRGSASAVTGFSYISALSRPTRTARWAEPLGKVPTDDARSRATNRRSSSRSRTLGSLKRALGDLDRVTAWLRVYAMVNSAPGFNQNASGHQWLLRPDPLALRSGSWHARALIDRHDAAAERTRELRSRGRNRRRALSRAYLDTLAKLGMIWLARVWSGVWS